MVRLGLSNEVADGQRTEGETGPTPGKQEQAPANGGSSTWDRAPAKGKGAACGDGAGEVQHRRQEPSAADPAGRRKEKTNSLRTRKGIKALSDMIRLKRISAFKRPLQTVLEGR